MLGGPTARRGVRATCAALATAAACAVADDVDAGSHTLRRLLRKRTATNVIAWTGDAAAEQTVVLVAHHDAAHTGLLFHPGLVPAIADGCSSPDRRSSRWGRSRDAHGCGAWASCGAG